MGINLALAITIKIDIVVDHICYIDSLLVLDVLLVRVN